MKIIVHGINYFPELTGIGKYTGEMAKWLAARGHEVRVVTAPPYYPEWRVRDGFSSFRYKIEGVCGKKSQAEKCVDRLLVYRCPLWVPSHPSGVKRLLHLASFALSSLPIMLRLIFWKPDVVMVIEPPLMCSPTAALIAYLCNAKSWLHIQDFEVDAAFDMGILPPGRMRNWVLRIESGLMRCFDRVSTISHNMLRRVEEKGVDSARTLLFPNWVDTGEIFPLTGASDLREELAIPANAVVALYSGNMGEKQGLEVVLESAIQIQSAKDKAKNKLNPCDLNLEPEILFVMCGDGAVRKKLMQAYGSLPNVLWIPLQPLERLNELLNMADIHLLPQREDVADLVMPSKLTGILASGQPVIATALASTQVARVVSNCGIVTPPGDAEEFTRSLVRLAMDADLRAEYGKKARRYAIENLDKQVILADFEKNLRTLGAFS